MQTALSIPERLDAPAFESPLARQLFLHALRQRYGAEVADRVFGWIQTPFDDLTPHQQRIVNLVLLWATLRNAFCGSIGIRVAGGKSLTQTPAEQRAQPRHLPTPELLRIE